MLMPSNAKHMLDKFQKHTDHNLGMHLQYADHIIDNGCIELHCLWEQTMEKKGPWKMGTDKNQFLELLRPTAGS